ncbi:MAG TPA: ribosomal protein S18-alanine N-acetyltransferase [Clostridia bacterium]|jgi:ribosomal-protein-alanine N-acetyltransferase|nr:ribosomal protein S18-alanine N-acetyltransferase [Clostridia bacterium]
MLRELAIRPMELSDLDRVLEIEKKSFPSPWSKYAYLSELCENKHAHYLVGEVLGKVVSYGGIWTILDEAHITTIAVDPDYRGRNYGEQMLAALIKAALQRMAEKMTLEVRKSNYPAQSLYLKFGFEPAGIRKGYYVDNNEDAIIMWKQLV